MNTASGLLYTNVYVYAYVCQNYLPSSLLEKGFSTFQHCPFENRTFSTHIHVELNFSIFLYEKVRYHLQLYFKCIYIPFIVEISYRYFYFVIFVFLFFLIELCYRSYKLYRKIISSIRFDL